MDRTRRGGPGGRTRTSLISRRRFLRVAGAAAGGAGAVVLGESAAHARGRWTHVTDVLVVGSGAAGLTAAVVAAQYGARVLVLEKANSTGGTTARSGGGHWIPNNSFMQVLGLEDPREDALRYMARFSYPHLYDPEDPLLGLGQNEFGLIAAYYDNAAAAVDHLTETGVLQSVTGLMANGQPWPDYFDHAPENRAPRGRVLFPAGADGRAGMGFDLIRQLETAARARGIQILLGHRATRLVLGVRRGVLGLEATNQAGGTVGVRAHQAVVFASGGFTHDRELRLHHQRGPCYGGCAVPTNEGDFVRIAGAAGAKLGNMTSAWRHQIILDDAMVRSATFNAGWQLPGDSMILVDRYGRRVVNEKRNYNDRTEVHFNYDPSREEWPNLVLFLVYDQRTAELFAGDLPLPGPRVPVPYVLAASTLGGLRDAIATRLASFARKIGGFRLDDGFASTLAATIARFNVFAETGVDEDFRRGATDYDRDWHRYQFSIPREGTPWPANDKPNVTMYPLSAQGPYYAIPLVAGMLDTNGGPMVNPEAQVLDTAGQPIPGLYGAGNCIASPTGRAYWGPGSTIGPAITFGYLAGRNAAREPVPRPRGPVRS